jgi:hypothetical protein
VADRSAQQTLACDVNLTYARRAASSFLVDAFRGLSDRSMMRSLGNPSQE